MRSEHFCSSLHLSQKLEWLLLQYCQYVYLCTLFSNIKMQEVAEISQYNFFSQEQKIFAGGYCSKINTLYLTSALSAIPELKSTASALEGGDSLLFHV